MANHKWIDWCDGNAWCQDCGQVLDEHTPTCPEQDLLDLFNDALGG
jgi:hypothetical protein